MKSAAHRGVMVSSEEEFHRARRSMTSVVRPAPVVPPANSLYLPIEQFVFVAGKFHRSSSLLNDPDVQYESLIH
ncbi:MAG: hypothetical protein P8M36_08675 [Gammaproteobacteria bacterium]|nr:hypothetical protein [Gammaproteobacteria bacterium]